MNDPSSVLAIFILVGVVFGVFSSTVASKKGYSSGAWFFGGMFFNIVALIAAAGLPLKRDEVESTPPAASKGTRDPEVQAYMDEQKAKAIAASAGQTQQ